MHDYQLEGLSLRSRLALNCNDTHSAVRTARFEVGLSNMQRRLAAGQLRTNG